MEKKKDTREKMWIYKDKEVQKDFLHFFLISLDI